MIEIIALSLTVLALSFAAWQMYAASNQAKRINLIHQSLTTRYLDCFPEFLSKTIDLINRSKSTLEIYVDVPGYSIFSNPDYFVRYKNSIEEKLIQGVKIDMVFLNAEKRRDSFNEIFPTKIEDWEEWKSKSSVKQKLEQFLNNQCNGESVENLTPEQLYLGLEKAYERVISSSFRGVNINEIESPLSMHFWISDTKEAVFTIPSFNPNDVTQGFTTSDPRLISALHTVIRRYEST